MARPKLNPDHDPIKARDELVKAVAEVYLHPESDMEIDNDGHATMKELRLQFGLTMTKIRKLLVTAGVYKFEKDGVDLVQEVQRLAAEGKKLEEIKEILQISTGTANSFLPYKSGTYNADFTADGYDYSNVSTDAKRKRNQRKREKMKESNVVEEHVGSIEDYKRQMDEKKYPGMTPEQIKEEKARRHAQNEANRQKNLERKRKYHERKAEAEEKDPHSYLHMAERYESFMPDYAARMRRCHEIEMRKRAGEIISDEDREAFIYQEPDARVGIDGFYDDGVIQNFDLWKKNRVEKPKKKTYEKIGYGDNVMYAPAIDYDAYDRLSEEEKLATQELDQRILDWIAEREEVKLPEIDVETYGDGWASPNTINGNPIGNYLFAPDFSYKYMKWDGSVAQYEPGCLIGVIDENHEKHIFGFDIYEPGLTYTFKAYEVKRLTKAGKVAAGQPDTEYSFEVLGDIKDMGKCIKALVDKTAISLNNLSIERKGRMWNDSPAQCLTDKYVLHAKESGRIRVDWSGTHDGGVAFQVDGHIYSSVDAVKLFSAYEGWDIHYAIRDPNCTFTNDMTLYPTVMNEDTLVGDLSKILTALTDKHEGKFIGKAEVPILDIMMEDLMKKLNFYYNNESAEVGKKVAASMIKMLKGIGSDSDIFPEFEILMIKDAARYPWEELK